MKLFTKIFLQVTCVILILSSAIFFYTTCRWKDQSLQDINRFQTSISQFENQLRIAGSQSDAFDPDLQEKILVYSFRHVFHDSAALYCDGKELYNGTSYEFEAETIRRLTAETLPQKKLYDYDPVISKTDGKTLLLYSYFSTEYTGEENYQIVTYKDITDVLKRSQILFFQAGALTLEKLEAMTAVCSVGIDMVAVPGDTTAEVISGLIADEIAIGVVNTKTTAVRVIPAIGKGVGDMVEFGGLLGSAPIMPIKTGSPAKFINRGGRIPAPIQSLKN